MSAATFGALILVVSGAVIAFLPNYLMERHKERSTMANRWGESLRMLCSGSAGTARELLQLSRQLNGSADEDARRTKMLAGGLMKPIFGFVP